MAVGERAWARRFRALLLWGSALGPVTGQDPSDEASLRAALVRSEGLRLRVEARHRVASDPSLALLLADEAAARLGEVAVLRELVDAGSANTFTAVLSRSGPPVTAITFDARGARAAVLRQGPARERDPATIGELFDLRQEGMSGRWALPSDTRQALPLAGEPGLLTLHGDGSIRVWRGNERRRIGVFGEDGGEPRWRFSACSVSPDEKWLAVGAAGGVLVRVDLDSLTPGAATVGDAIGLPSPIAWRDGRVLVTRLVGRVHELLEVDAHGAVRTLAKLRFAPWQATRVGESAWLLMGDDAVARLDDDGTLTQRRTVTGWLRAPATDRVVQAPQPRAIDAYGNTNEDAGRPVLASFVARRFERDGDDGNAGFPALATLGPHADAVRHVQFDARGEVVFTTDDVGWRLWASDEGAPLAVGAIDGLALGGARLAPDGSCVLSGVGSDAVRLWRLDTPGRRLTFPPVANDLFDVALSADGRWLATAGSYGDGFLFDRTLGRYVIRRARVIDWNGGGTWPGVPKGGNRLAFDDANGRLYVSYLAPDNRGSVRAYDVATGEALPAGDGPHTAEAPDLDIEVDQSRAQLTVRRRTEGGTRTLFTFTEPDGRIHGWTACPAADVLAFGLGDGEVVLADLRTGTIRTRFRAHREAVLGLALTADARLLATASRDNTARIWPLAPRAFFADAIRRLRNEPALLERLARIVSGE